MILNISLGLIYYTKGYAGNRVAVYMRVEGFTHQEGKEESRKRFLEILLTAGSARSGEDISRVKVVGEESLGVRGSSPGSS